MGVFNYSKVISDDMHMIQLQRRVYASRNREKCNYSKWISLLIGIACAFILAACAMDQEKKRDQADMHVNIGVAYIEVGDYNGALKELLVAEKFTPRDQRVHYFLAMAYQGKGYQDKAIEECKTAISLKADYSEAHNLLGTIYMNVGSDDLAIESFTKALDNMLYETPSIALYNLGRVYDRRGDYPKAMAKYREAVSRNYRGGLLPLIEHSMGKVAYAQGDIPNATAHFKKSTDLAPTYAESYYWLGECYVKRGNLSEAKKAFETVIKLAPDSDFSDKSKEIINKIKK
jgi:type IV pilus assembly protein PilF